MITGLEIRLARVAQSYAPNPRLLALLRILFGVWMIVFPVDLLWIDRVPDEFFHARPGLFSFMEGPPSSVFLTSIMAVKVVLAIMLIVGIFTLPVSFLISAAFIVGSGVTYSYSKVDHFILFELTPVFLALAGWGSVYSVDSFLRQRLRCREPSHIRGMPILLFAMTIGFAMLTAALQKMSGGWLDPERHGARGYLARDIVRDEKLGPFGPMALRIDNGLFWKFLDYATLVAEAGLVLTVLFPTLFRLWLLLIAAFHLNVYLVLGISFADYLLVYAVFFSPAYTWLERRMVRARMFSSVGAIDDSATGRSRSRE